MNTSTLDFDKVVALFDDMGSKLSPAQLHGFLTGQLSLGKRFNDQQLLEACDEYLTPEQGFSVDNEQSLLFIYSHLLNALASDDFAFYPLLPGDTQALALRLEQFVLWCDAFIEGFSLAHQKQNLDQKTQEVLADIVAITQLDSAEETGDEQEAEHYLSDILEYVRVAIIALYADHQPAAKESTRSAHSIQDLFKDRSLH